MTSRTPLPVAPHRAALFGLGMAAALSACATATYEPPPGPPTPTAADRHRIVVEQTGERLDLPVTSDTTSLSAETRSRLAAFGEDYVSRGHGALILSAPSGGENASAAAVVAQEARLVLAQAGVSFAAIAGSTYDASGFADAPVVISFSRYEAFAPDCRPIWEQDLMENRHMAYESFGCSLNANLAAMIDDPADLLQPRAETPRDAARRAAVLERYRQGAPTHATRSGDERVSISNAVQ